MNQDSAFSDYGLGIHDNGAPSDDLDYHFNFHDAEHGNDAIAVDPVLTLSPYTTTTPESQFNSPSSTSILSPNSSVEYFGDHRGSFSASDTIAPHDTLADQDEGTTKKQAGSKQTAAKSKTSSEAAPSVKARSKRPASQSIEMPSPPATRSKKQKMATRSTDADDATTTTTTTTTTAAASVKQETTTMTSTKTTTNTNNNKRTQPKRKSPRKAAACSSSSSSSSTSSRKEDGAQRSKNLERNRIAASKCRQKKKEWVHDLEATKSEMEQRHNALRLEYFSLLDEVTHIKNHLMEHVACNDPNINFWIEKEAFRYVERCMDPNQDKRPSLVSTGSGSFTLPSPGYSQQSCQTSPIEKHSGINLDYMPDELLVGGEAM